MQTSLIDPTVIRSIEDASLSQLLSLYAQRNGMICASVLFSLLFFSLALSMLFLQRCSRCAFVCSRVFPCYCAGHLYCLADTTVFKPTYSAWVPGNSDSFEMTVVVRVPQQVLRCAVISMLFFSSWLLFCCTLPVLLKVSYSVSCFWLLVASIFTYRLFHCADIDPTFWKLSSSPGFNTCPYFGPPGSLSLSCAISCSGSRLCPRAWCGKRGSKKTSRTFKRRITLAKKRELRCWRNEQGRQ